MNDLQKHKLKKAMGTTKQGKENWKTRNKWFIKTVFNRLKVIAISTLTLFLLIKFDLANIQEATSPMMYITSGIFMVIGTISILAILTMILPYPHWFELKAGKDREKYHGDQFKDGIL